MIFHKRTETYSPADLCWIVVTFNNQTNAVSVGRTGETEMIICEGEVHQLDEMIALLQHVRRTHFGEETE